MPVKGGESTVSPINKGKINAYDTKHEKTDEVVNYEISRTVSKIIMPVGIIKKLSVAVLVDGVYHKNDKGVEEFQPRTKKAMATLGDLVKKAIGYDAERGDRVVVTSVPFRKAESDMDLTEEGAWSDQVTAYMPVIKYVLALIVLLFIVLFVLRPLIKSLLAKGHDEEVRIREIQTVAGGQLGSESSAYKLGESEAGVSKEVATVKQMAAQDSNSFSELLRNWLK
jgi:flagellar M-ring protein FliF